LSRQFIIELLKPPSEVAVPLPVRELFSVDEDDLVEADERQRGKVFAAMCRDNALFARVARFFVVQHTKTGEKITK
jgi:hypothetical protein